MTQQELDLILTKHKLWLDSGGSEGECAHFDNDRIDLLHEHNPASMRIRLYKGGGTEAVGGIPYVDGVKSVFHRPSHFTDLDFRKADLRNAIFKKALFYKCNMEEVNFGACDLSQSVFIEVNLQSTRYGGFFTEPFANLKGIQIIRCCVRRNFLQQQDLSESDLSGSDFSDSNMISAKFVGAILAGSKFHNVSLSTATFSSCDLSYAVFKEVDLSGADLSLTNLKFTTFADTNLAGCKWQFESFSTRVLEAFSVNKPKRFLGCRVDSAYGNERFKKAVREEAYIEEVTQAHPFGYKLWLLSSDCGRSIRIWSLWSILFAFVFAWIIYRIGLAGFTFNEQVTALIKVSVHFRTSYSHLRSRDKLCTHHYRRVIWQSELTATLHNGSN